MITLLLLGVLVDELVKEVGQREVIKWVTWVCDGFSLEKEHQSAASQLRQLHAQLTLARVLAKTCTDGW